MSGTPVLRRAKAQADAGPLMPMMVRRANMRPSIAARGRIAKPRRVSGIILTPAWSDAAGPDFRRQLCPRDIPRDHAAGPDHRAVTNRHARQDNGAATYPDVAADPHRSSEFEPAAPRFGIPGMVGGVDLRRGSDLGAIADRDLDHIEDDAIEIQEHPVAEADVVAVVAKERRADHGSSADMTETFGQQRVTLGNGQRQRRVVAHEPRLGRSLVG